jgi:aminoglycoside phosphotransferase (APT) family kinase protein
MVLNIEDAPALLAYLRAAGHLAAGVTATTRVLRGGVSNRTVWVGLSTGGAWVLKQALPKLRVEEDWFCDPARVGREALALRWLQQLAPAASVPQLIFEDPEQRLLAMSAVPEPQANWKERLLAGDVQSGQVEQFGRWLAQVHTYSRARQAELRAPFADRIYFETLRLDPYYRVAASRNPRARQFYEELTAETWATRLCLVHGDYSPKNVLIHQGKLVVLDFEVMHFGDPAFDLGFGLTHLLSKANHLPACRGRFAEAALGFWKAYRETPMLRDAGLERRAVQHALGCLLARVDGRSPLEYLSPDERETQRRVVLHLIERPPTAMAELVDSICRLLDAPA